jgi:hypothetical protein
LIWRSAGAVAAIAIVTAIWTAASAEVRDAGVRLYAIGLGADVDEAALKTMAGDDEHYYHAPDSADLASIYEEIAQDLMCPGVELWVGR